MYIQPHREQISMTVNALIVFFVFTSLIIGTLNSMTNVFSVVGLLALMFVLVFSNFVLLTHHLIYRKVRVEHFVILVITILFSSISIISAFYNSLPFEIVNTAQFILCLGFTVFISTLNWNGKTINIIYVLTSVFVLFNFFIWIINGFPRMFSSIFPNSNTFGPYMFLSIFIILLKLQTTKNKVSSYFILFTALLLMLFSDTRSIIIASIVAIIIYTIWKYITATKLLSTLFFTIFTIIMCIVLFLYPRLPQWSNFYYVEKWMIETTGKSMMSGRDEIWLAVTEVINLSPLLGYGPDTIPSDILVGNYSTHNIYLNIALQTGYIGLLVFFILIYFIFMNLRKNRNHNSGKLVGAYFFAILVHQMFEITLIQNQLSIGLLQWLVIGIGLSFSINLNKNTSQP